MTSDELLNDLEGACNYTLQQIRLFRAAKRELRVLKSNGHAYTPSRIRKSEQEAERIDRNLAKVTDELVEYGMKVTGHITYNPQPAPQARAARGD